MILPISRFWVKNGINKCHDGVFWTCLSVFFWDIRFVGETEGVTKGDVIASGALLKSLECDDGDAASGCC